MSKDMSPELEAAAQESEIITRMLVTISAPGQTFHFVANDNADVIMPDGTVYYSAEIKRGEIKTSTEGDKESVSLELSNKWRQWASYMAHNGKKLKGCTCTIEDVFLDHLEEGSVWRFAGTMDKLGMTLGKFTCTVSRDVVDYSVDAPVMDYGPTCQHTFGGERCKYVGAGGPCDQTMNSCEALGNILNFQGHPSIALEMVIRAS